MKKALLITLVSIGSSVFSLCIGQDVMSCHFDSLSSGISSLGAKVLALATKDSLSSSNIYAGGHFVFAGNNAARNIAEWNDTLEHWSPLGMGVDSDVCALVIFNGKLYAGGKFDSAGGIAASHIASWDTLSGTWDSLPGKLNGNVYALCVYNNALYVGGDFTMINGDTVNRIAKWDGNTWQAVGKGFDTAAVYALAVSNDTLYAGGSFLKSNGRVVNHIAVLKGAYWDSLGKGTNNTVYALAYWDWVGLLYVGGAFTKSGNVATNYISYYDPNYKVWDSIGPGTNDTVRVLDEGAYIPASIHEKSPVRWLSVMLVGGNFDSAGGYSSHFIAGLDFSSSWDVIGDLSGPVYALAAPYYSNYSNYVGGQFTTGEYEADVLNNVASFAVWGFGSVPSIGNNTGFTVYPNPSSGVFTIQSSVVSCQWSVEVYNVLGEKVYSQFNIHNSQFNIDLSGQPDGIYLYRVLTQSGNVLGQGKIVIQK